MGNIWARVRGILWPGVQCIQTENERTNLRSSSENRSPSTRNTAVGTEDGNARKQLLSNGSGGRSSDSRSSNSSSEDEFSTSSKKSSSQNGYHHDENNLIKKLQERTVFDIKKKKIKFVHPKNRPPAPAGQPPVVDNQGKEETCASYSVGKAIVDIIDGFGYDCNQQAIVENLIKTVQPDKKRAYIEKFCSRSIDVSVWKKDVESSDNISGSLMSTPKPITEDRLTKPPIEKPVVNTRIHFCRKFFFAQSSHAVFPHAKTVGNE